MKPAYLQTPNWAWLAALLLICQAEPAEATGRILLTNRPRKTIRSARTRRRKARLRLVRTPRPRFTQARQRHIPGRPYAGVLPGSAEKPPGPRPPASLCWLTWPGFQLTKGGSRVFFQLNKKVEQTVQSRKRGFDILFPGCRIRLKNNMHRLVTAYFPSTPVFDIRTINTKKGVVARIRLKTSAHPRIQWLTKEGWAYLLVDFGPYGRGRAASRIEATRPRSSSGGNPLPASR